MTKYSPFQMCNITLFCEKIQAPLTWHIQMQWKFYEAKQFRYMCESFTRAASQLYGGEKKVGFSLWSNLCHPAKTKSNQVTVYIPFCYDSIFKYDSSHFQSTNPFAAVQVAMQHCAFSCPRLNPTVKKKLIMLPILFDSTDKVNITCCLGTSGYVGTLVPQAMHLWKYSIHTSEKHFPNTKRPCLT